MADDAQSAPPVTPGRVRPPAVFLLLFVALLCVACRISDIEKVFTPGGVTFFDSDTYTRMERVRQVERCGGLPVRFHAFENAPYGIVSHATSPLDYAILAASLPLRFLLPPDAARDVAGAWISPLIGLAGLFVLFVLLRGEPGRWWVLLAYALLPALGWAQNVGRPDHQSLLTALLAVALAAEWRMAGGPDTSRGTRRAAGCAWGLALWVSLFEPLILAGACFALGFFTGSSWVRRGRDFFVPLAVLVAARFVVDPWPALPPASDAAWLRNWGALIGELRGSSLVEMVYWTGLWVPTVLVAALVLIRGGVMRGRAAFAAALVVLLGALTMWQIRWSAYLAVALAVPGMLLFFSRRAGARGLILAVLCYAPVLLYYANFHLRWKQPSEGVAEMRQVTDLISRDPATVLAPWWISPVIGYQSGAPFVASSSHQSIQGIVDVSEFFLTPHWDMAREILIERGAGWVVTAEPERMFSQAMAVAHGLRVPVDEKILWKDVSYRVAMGTRLARGMSPAPEELRLLGVFGPYRVYRFLPRTGGGVSD